MPHRDTVVVGASAGGVEALRTLVRDLPAGLRATVVVVLHTPATGVNALAAVLRRSAALEVVAAEQETPLRPGTVVVARPDHHLVVVDDEVILTRGPRENGHRPAVDVLFRSAARVRGPRVIGVILSGSLDDGAAGLVTVRARGGIGVVQHPDDALHSGMPTNAIAAAAPEHVVPVAEMGALVDALVREPVPEGSGPADPLLEVEIDMARMDPEALLGDDRPGRPVALSCPDCQGTMFTIDDAGYVRYRCRVGHAWSPESLLAAGDAALESALWTALRTLEEKAALTRQMSARSSQGGRAISAEKFAAQAADTAEAAALLRRMLVSGAGISAHPDVPDVLPARHAEET